MYMPDISDRILAALKKNQNVPIYQIAKEANVSVATASKYCHILAAQNKIKMVSFGNMKLVSKS